MKRVRIAVLLLAGAASAAAQPARRLEFVRDTAINLAGAGVRGLAAVPFSAFGEAEGSGWFRLSVGAVSPTDIQALLPRLRLALEALG